MGFGGFLGTLAILSAAHAAYISLFDGGFLVMFVNKDAARGVVTEWTMLVASIWYGGAAIFCAFLFSAQYRNGLATADGIDGKVLAVFFPAGAVAISWAIGMIVSAGNPSTGMQVFFFFPIFPTVGIFIIDKVLEWWSSR